MRDTDPALPTAIAELRCIRDGHGATLKELHALRVARERIDDLLRSRVEQLRSSRAAMSTEFNTSLERDLLIPLDLPRPKGSRW